jgi:hypothetical protein
MLLFYQARKEIHGSLISVCIWLVSLYIWSISFTERKSKPFPECLNLYFSNVLIYPSLTCGMYTGPGMISEPTFYSLKNYPHSEAAHFIANEDPALAGSNKRGKRKSR